MEVLSRAGPNTENYSGHLLKLISGKSRVPAGSSFHGRGTQAVEDERKWPTHGVKTMYAGMRISLANISLMSRLFQSFVKTP